MKRVVPFILFVFSAVCFAQSSKPMVTDIDAVPIDTKQITITWKLPSSPITQLIIYRDTNPISSRTKLSSILPVATISGSDSIYTDQISDYREYYYAVVSVTNGIPSDIILPSVNATVTGVRVFNQISSSDSPSIDVDAFSIEKEINSPEEKPIADGEMRVLPLPYLNILPSKSDNSEKISDVATESALSLVDTTATNKKLEPYIFSEDKNSNQAGDEYSLYSIISTDFSTQKYNVASKSLTDFLQIRRSDEVTYRAQFYLGECYYYLGKYREALNTFLLIPSSYEVLSKRWIQAVLEAM